MSRSYRSVTEQSIHYLVRPQLGQPSGPVESLAAWRGAELAEKSQQPLWLIELGRAEQDELDAALAAARRTGKPLLTLTAADFPLPTLRPRIHRWAGALHSGIGVQVLRGLDLTRWSVEDCGIVFFGLGLHLGVPGAQNRFEELLGHVRDEGLSYSDPSVRGYRTTAHLSYHCDAADVVGLFCLRTAKSGGRSRFVSSVTVWNELHARRPDLAARLFSPFELDTRGDGGLNFFPIAPCRYANGELRTFYHADYFRTVEKHPGARRLGALEHEVLDLYDQLASDPALYFEMDFQPGDIQLLSNHTVLHARTAYVDHDEPDRKRHLLRLWLSLPQRRRLSELPSLALETARLLQALVRGRLRDRRKA